MRALKLACAGVSEGTLPVHRTMAVSSHMWSSLEPCALTVSSVFCSCAGIPGPSSETQGCMLLPTLALKSPANRTWPQAEASDKCAANASNLACAELRLSWTEWLDAGGI